ncbi:MAG TPA: ABC transporter ATP-binding protein [Bryobacteraceae bacterium]|jgi:ABC-2 type transport system ATP-binding protein|nr:ABC transporter ATP-binding protein [Bryobacteraceae bacterium]
MTDPVIELDGLEVCFGGRPILKKLKASLTGRSIGLLGPNGAGKSTLLNTLLGFHQPAAGTARVLGHDIRTDARQVRGLIGYMPENDAFIASMSGVRFVRLMAELSGLPPEQALERAHEAFFYVGLGEVRYRALGTYSLGMKQAAKLAQAIAHGPKLLFLDEPTNGLDPPARARMIQLIQEIRERGDLSLILSSHLLRDVEECCDQVLILKDGNIAAYCNLEEERRANRRFLELETRSDGVPSGCFLEALEKLGCEIAQGALGRVKLVLPEGLEVRRLYAVAAEQNVQIRRLNRKRDSLEDIFLKAMETGNGRL